MAWLSRYRWTSIQDPLLNTPGRVDALDRRHTLAQMGVFQPSPSHSWSFASHPPERFSASRLTQAPESIAMRRTRTAVRLEAALASTPMHSGSNSFGFHRHPLEGAYSLVPDDDSADLAEHHPQTFRERGAALIAGMWFQGITALLIVGNAVVLGLEVDYEELGNWKLYEKGFLVAFLMELLLKLVVVGPCMHFSCMNPEINWNIFDALVVGSGVVDTVFSNYFGTKGGVETICRMLRLLRILRVIRIVKFMKQLYLLAFGLVEAAKAIFWVTVLMTGLLYICSVIIVKSVGRPGELDPHAAFLDRHFGTVPQAMLTLFVLISSPNLPVYQDEAGLLESRPGLTMFLICFIIFCSFGMIALLTGVISESMFDKNDLRKEETRMELERLRSSLAARCGEVFAGLGLDAEGKAHKDDVHKLQPDIERIFESAGLDWAEHDISAMITLMSEKQDKISSPEFVRGMLLLTQGLCPVVIEELHCDVMHLQHMMTHMEERINSIHADHEETWRELRAHSVSSSPSEAKVQRLEDLSHEILKNHKHTQEVLRGHVASSSPVDAKVTRLEMLTSEILRQHKETREVLLDRLASSSPAEAEKPPAEAKASETTPVAPAPPLPFTGDHLAGEALAIFDGLAQSARRLARASAADRLRRRHRRRRRSDQHGHAASPRATLEGAAARHPQKPRNVGDVALEPGPPPLAQPKGRPKALAPPELVGAAPLAGEQCSSGAPTSGADPGSSSSPRAEGESPNH